VADNPRILDILRELAEEACPADFNVIEAARLGALQKAARLIIKGHYVKTALSLANGPRSISAFYRLIHYFKEHGIEGLRSKYPNCGRRRNLSPTMLRLVSAHLALRAVQAEIKKRLAPGDVGAIDSPKVREAAASFLRAGKMATLPEDELSEIILTGVLRCKAWQFPADLRPVAEEIEELAAKALFPENEDGGEP
jgi:hypothetical protein